MGSGSAIIWDFDGTLAQRPGMWSQCLADVANEHLGRQLPRDRFVPFLQGGFPWHSPQVPHTHLNSADEWWTALEPLLAAAIAGAAGVEVPMARMLAGRVRERYTDAVSWETFSDTLPALEALSRSGWEHVLLSNHVPELPRIVSALGMTAHFKAVLSSASIGYEKPRRECFEVALTYLPEATRTIVVGDSHAADMVGAMAAGLEGILVRSRPQGTYRHFDNLQLLVRHLQTM